jgi:hypothetical protein
MDILNLSPFFLSTLLLLLFLPMPTTADLALLPTRDAARSMSWAQLEHIFKEGTIDEGIPESFSYGYALVNPAFSGAIQVAADIFWKGKRLEVKSGENCYGRDCGQMGVVLNYLGASDRVQWQEMPGIAYIGQLKDIKPSLEPLQLDDNMSIIVDYQNGGGDELRLVNSKERIYLGRGVDWVSPQLYAYFVLQFYDTPQKVELAFGTPHYYQARERAYLAAGATQGPDPLQMVQAMPDTGREGGFKYIKAEKDVSLRLPGGGDTTAIERLGARFRGSGGRGGKRGD